MPNYRAPNYYSTFVLCFRVLIRCLNFMFCSFIPWRSQLQHTYPRCGNAVCQPTTTQSQVAILKPHYHVVMTCHQIGQSTFFQCATCSRRALKHTDCSCHIRSSAPAWRYCTDRILSSTVRIGYFRVLLLQCLEVHRLFELNFPCAGTAECGNSAALSILV